MAYYLYSLNYEKYYCSHWYSPAALLCYCTYVIILTIPFILVASTQNLWVTQVDVFEQISFDFKTNSQYFITVLSLNSGTATYASDLITNMKNQEATQQNILQRSVSYSQQDYNQDGIVDHIEIDVTMILNSPTTTVQEIDAIFFFDFTLQSATKIQSSGMMRFNTKNFAALPLKSVVFTGTSRFVQSKPLPRSKYTYLQMANVNPFFDNNFIIEKAFEAYYRRDLRIEAAYETHIAAIWSSTFPDNQVTAKIVLDLDGKNLITYKPTLLHLVRDAWIQYFSLFLPFLIFGQFFLRFVYKYKFFFTYLQDNLPRRDLKR